MVESAATGEYIYELNVGMTCEACSKAVTKILTKCEDISNVECDVPNKKVTVRGKDGLDIAEMLAKWVSFIYWSV